MLIKEIQTVLLRDLQKLRQEIAAYSNEAAVWRTDKNIKNSAGNLCLHLCGNLRHFIGAVLGKTGYVRNREAEFSSKDIPAEELIRQIDETINAVSQTLDKTDDQQLANEYPLVVFDAKMTTGYFLVHLSSHLGYHLGQINYHRRLLDV